MFETRKPSTTAMIVTTMVFLCISGGILGSPRSLEEINVIFKSSTGEKYTTSTRHFVHPDGAR
jgi:hypothetical protein